jgi:hypothetical protein
MPMFRDAYPAAAKSEENALSPTRLEPEHAHRHS